MRPTSRSIRRQISWALFTKSPAPLRNSSSSAKPLGSARMAQNVDYNKWTKDNLIKRLRELEHDLEVRTKGGSSPAAAAAPVPQEKPQEETGNEEAAAVVIPKKRKEKQKMDPSSKSFRYVALKLAYLGRNYGGFEYSASGTLPSIEEELFKALTKACLIFPEDERAVDFGNCEYSKCGRTDRGVSAFGQVIGLKLRSARPLEGARPKRQKLKEGEANTEATSQGAQQASADAMETDHPEPPPFDPILDEINYPKVLNRILPKDIRILAWCPSPPPEFSARFSCRERQYRYFFTQPAFSPPPPSGSQSHVGWLDIEAMRDAAKRFEGEHDFRNFCKIDPAKNITNYKRGILEATIEEVDHMASTLPYIQPPTETLPTVAADGQQYPKVYCFKVRGTAFLWHQIRNMVSILFHIGQGLESPDLVDKLLDIESNPRRPVYVMADEVPLVLWDCLFPGEDGKELDWIYVEDDVDPSKPSLNMATTETVWKLWREVKTDEILASGLLGKIARPTNSLKRPAKSDNSVKLFEGGNSARAGGKYVPIMKLKLMDSPAEQNDRYAQRKGFANAEDMARQKAAKWEQTSQQDDE